MKRILPISLLLVSTALPCLSHACTTIIVGKQATADGSIIIARNEDSDGATDAQNMTRHPARKDALVFISNSITNPNSNRFTWQMPPNALGYVAFPHWQSLDKQNLSFEETGINDYGVALSATETIFNSAKALKADPYLLKSGLTEDSIASVVLPYATSAKEGVRLLGGMIEKAGAGEGFGVAFSDSNEAWYLETASGHHWLAARIPDNALFVTANQGRLQQARLDEPMNFLASAGLMEFVVKNGLYQPDKGAFNLFECCIEDIPHDKTYNYPRVRELLNFFAGIKYKADDGLYPVFVQPDRKLTVKDVSTALRNRYNGSAHDPYMNRNPQEPYRPVSVMRASLSHITQTRPGLPEDIAVVQYIALGMTDLSPYVPFFKGLTDVPSSYQGARGKVDDRSLFWKSRKLQALVLQDYPRFAPMVHAEIAGFEQMVEQKQAAMEADYLKIWRQDRRAARQLIQKFMDEVIKQQERVLAELTGKIAQQLGLQKLTNQQFDELINRTEKLYHFHGA